MLNFSVTFIISIINIAVLFFILRAILFKPVTKFMENRARLIQDSIDQAEKDKNEAKALLAQYETRLKTAEMEAGTILREARESARIEAEKVIAEGRAAAEALLTNGRKQLELERTAAFADFRKEAAALVMAASGRLVEREIRNEDSLYYASSLLKELAPDSAAGVN